MWPSPSRAPTRPRRRRCGTPTSRRHGAGSISRRSASSCAWSPPNWRGCRSASATSTRNCGRCGCIAPGRRRSSTTRRSPDCSARRRRGSCRRPGRAPRRSGRRPRRPPSACCARRARTPSTCVTRPRARPAGVAETPSRMPRPSWRWPSSRVARWSRRPAPTASGCSASCPAVVISPASRSTSSSTAVIGSCRRSSGRASSPPTSSPSSPRSAS